MENDKKPVLVVDDERAALDIVCQAIGNDGFPLLCAAKPAEAVKLFEASSPFLVLTDLSLGNHVDGVTMADRMHMKDPLCIFIAISGYLDVWGVGYLLGSVFTDILRKPCSLDIIQKVLNYAWEKRQRWERVLDGA